MLDDRNTSRRSLTCIDFFMLVKISKAELHHGSQSFQRHSHFTGQYRYGCLWRNFVEVSRSAMIAVNKSGSKQKNNIRTLSDNSFSLLMFSFLFHSPIQVYCDLFDNIFFIFDDHKNNMFNAKKCKQGIIAVKTLSK